MDKGIIGAVLATCLSGGACLGGISSFTEEYRYDQTLRDPNLYYLVDSVGNPVSQEME